LYRLACWLLARHQLVHRPLRLLGLGVSGLSKTAGGKWFLTGSRTRIA
jgi:hypothetical protein